MLDDRLALVRHVDLRGSSVHGTAGQRREVLSIWLPAPSCVQEGSDSPFRSGTAEALQVVESERRHGPQLHELRQKTARAS
jgi:hypothetical protein